jgi:hypothetical protein
VLRRIGPALRPSTAPVDRSAYGWRERDEDDLAALATDSQDAMAVFLAEVVDAGAAGFEDSQPEKAEQGNESEVVRVVRQPGGGDQGFELQMAEPESGRFRRYRWSADIVGR